MRAGLLAVVSLAAAGCGGSWTVIKQAAPNPFTPESTFSVAPADFEGLKVAKKTEAEWLADKDEKAKMIHEGDKQSYANEFVTAMNTRARGLKVAAEGASFTVKSHVQWMEPGYYAMVSHAPARVRVRVDIVDGSGAVVDMLEVRGTGEAIEPLNPVPRATIGERLRKCADDVAARLTRYLRERAGIKG